MLCVVVTIEVANMTVESEVFLSLFVIAGHSIAHQVTIRDVTQSINQGDKSPAVRRGDLTPKKPSNLGFDPGFHRQSATSNPPIKQQHRRRHQNQVQQQHHQQQPPHQRQHNHLLQNHQPQHHDPHEKPQRHHHQLRHSVSAMEQRWRLHQVEAQMRREALLRCRCGQTPMTAPAMERENDATASARRQVGSANGINRSKIVKGPVVLQEWKHFIKSGENGGSKGWLGGKIMVRFVLWYLTENILKMLRTTFHEHRRGLLESIFI